MKPETHEYSVSVGEQELTFETGELASQAGGAVTLRVGDAMIFATATMSDDPREGISFFPLTVDYEERMYAGGRIPGSFFRREGRPTEDAILTARLTDRPLRPLFPKDMRNDVQVIMYSFSSDEVHPLDILCINAASAALTISDIPWSGPVGAVRVAYVDGRYLINPTYEQLGNSVLDLRVAGTKDAILMVECGAYEVPENVMIEALDHAHQAIGQLVELQERMAQELAKPKKAYPPFTTSEELVNMVEQRAYSRLEEILETRNSSKNELDQAIREYQTLIVDELAADEGGPTRSDVIDAISTVYKKVVRRRILEKGIRPDGRGTKDIRNIWCDVNYSPRAHGSGLFTRGETQVLTLATLGTPRDAQELDILAPIENKRYMHHYNFPPFSVGETRPLRGASRREVGHGALAERALLPVIPDESEFPYTLRLVSEVLSSNGSTSMASVCGSTLALMDTGVPIKAPVAGIAMGLIKDGERYAVLTDIQGIEDHLGDMDFKVAGTRKGITALQMDIKIKGISPEIMSEALEQANQARNYILDKILEVIPVPRPDLKEFVPRISTVQIPVEKIGAVIGPGGKMIRSIQEETGTQIDIQEDGTVFIASTDGEGERKARERIQALTEEAKVGQIYTGKVVRTTDFGAFVEILPGQDGLVHISQLDTGHVRKVEDVARVGDEITVMVTAIDSEGKIRLSRQAVLEGWTAEEAIANDQGGRRSGRSSGGRGRSDRGRGGR